MAALAFGTIGPCKMPTYLCVVEYQAKCSSRLRGRAIYIEYNAQFKIFEPLEYSYDVCEAILLWEQYRNMTTVLTREYLDARPDGWLDYAAKRIAQLYDFDGVGPSILTYNPDLGRGGSTAVTAILINGQVLWVANVGDSRALLSGRGQEIQMSVDHEPNTERGSFENKVGFVSNMPGEEMLQL
ncbi:hypothetical protein AgCh_033818 [Apium graveolens]